MTSAALKYKRPEHSEIKYKNMRFLITDRPSDNTVDKYIEDLNKYGANVVVRVCDPSYEKMKLEESGIKVVDAAFPDGSTPPQEVRENWFDLLRDKFKQTPNTCIAIHCVAGLGRAPVMVALALMELGMTYEEAIEIIRSKRKGAINSKQLEFLEKYRPKNRLKSKKNSTCLIM